MLFARKRISPTSLFEDLSADGSSTQTVVEIQRGDASMLHTSSSQSAEHQRQISAHAPSVGGLDTACQAQHAGIVRPAEYRPSAIALRKATLLVRRRSQPPSSDGMPADKSKLTRIDTPIRPSMMERILTTRGKLNKSGGSVLDNWKEVERPAWKLRVVRVLDGFQVSMLVIFVTVLALYLDDLKLAALPPDADVYCAWVAAFCLLVYGSELLLASITRPGYFLKFFFWIDLVATVSLVFDIPGVVSALNGNQGVTGGYGAGSTALARGTSDQIGNRIRSITRVTRILRLMRLIALYQQWQFNRENAAMEASPCQGGAGNKTWSYNRNSRSRVGQKLSGITTRRVVILILTMLVMIPGFNINSGLYGDYPGFESGGLQLLHGLCLQDGMNTTGFKTAQAAFVSGTAYPLATRTTSNLLGLTICNTTFLPDAMDILTLRRDVELDIVKFQSMGCATQQWQSCQYTWAIFDLHWNSAFAATLNLLRTAFICLILIFGAVLFNRDSNKLVLQPIERMMKLVRDVAENPVAKHSTQQGGHTARANSQMETRILEQSILKICRLLAIGFGDAGAEVIADNIKSAEGLNPMIPGKKVYAVFGFCDVRNFTDATEVLQEDIMEFVNSIAKIVHMEVSLHGGAANKNVGDAFLLVWKFPADFAQQLALPSSTSLQPSLPTTATSAASALAAISTPFLGADSAHSQPASPTGTPMGAGITTPFLSTHPIDSRFGSPSGSPSASPMAAGYRPPTHAQQHQQGCDHADRALAAFVIIQSALKRCPRLQLFCNREDLNTRLPGFQVQLGFGLHVGWAIEGAIGSEYKIDASYLSPNVNMASRLEAATKQFGVSILLSEDFVQMLSAPVRCRTRQIDTVIVKGSDRPLGLYTYDVTLEHIIPPTIAWKLATPHATDDDCHNGAHGSHSTVPYASEFDEHPDLAQTWAVDSAFLARFAEGFEAYRCGDWALARTVLEETQEARRKLDGSVLLDGPSNTLLRVMRALDFVAPQGWQGYRKLVEK